MFIAYINCYNWIDLGLVIVDIGMVSCLNSLSFVLTFSLNISGFKIKEAGNWLEHRWTSLLEFILLLRHCLSFRTYFYLCHVITYFVTWFLIRVKCFNNKSDFFLSQNIPRKILGVTSPLKLNIQKTKEIRIKLWMG